MQNETNAPVPEVTGKIRMRKRMRAAISVTLAVLLALGSLLVFGQPNTAYAGTTGGDTSYYQLYDSNGSADYSVISQLRVDGASAYCVEINRDFAAGIYVSPRNAVDVYGQARVTEFALYSQYVKSISWLNDAQKYFIIQTMIWDALEGYSFSGGLRVSMGVSDQNQINIKNEARAYYQKYKDSYVGGGTFWEAGNAQDLAQFWVARNATGSIKLIKGSSDTDATDNNSRYSLAGAVYTIYNTSNVAVGTLTVAANGESNTVSGLQTGAFGTYYVKETKAPLGYERNTATYTVNLTHDGHVITVNAKDNPVLGRLELTKTSANPDMTDGNASYSLEGAEYGLFKSEADARALANSYKSIFTNRAGYASAEGLPLGEYWVREIAAPTGYALDDTIRYVDISLGQLTGQVSFSDHPHNDPLGILLQKLDIDTGLAYAGSDAATLEGAEFTVCYYDAQHATVADAQADTPTRTWVLRTDAEGYVLFDDEYLIGGDAFYKNSAGDAAIPIGTFTVQETRAPEGYLLSTAQLPNDIRIFHIIDDGSTDGEFLYVFNEYEVREQIVRGDLEIVKYQEDEVTTSDMPSELKTPEAGVTFDLYAEGDFAGTAPNAGAVPAFFITTDAEGVASTMATGEVMLAWPDGSYTTRPRTPNDSGALPYGTYLVIQRDAPNGYSPANAFTITVDEDKENHTYIVGNTLIASAIRVVKQDSETGMTVPYPATWQILDAETKEPVTMTVHYPATQDLDSFSSNNEGWLLLPEMLPYGSYLLHEVEAPTNGRIGYLLNSVDVPFEVTEYGSWDAPLVVTFQDAPATGQISLVKNDELSGNLVAGAEYAIFAAEDVYTLDGTLRYRAGEQVDTLITDVSGAALSCELYLGSYVVYETRTPDGFALNAQAYSVELTWQGQTAAVNIADVAATDTPTTLNLLKLDAVTGLPLAGVTFVVEAADGSVTELATGEDGRCSYPYLPQGCYKVYETATIPGYILSDEVREVTVDENGLIEGQATYELVFTNDFTKTEINKADIVTGEPVIGATLQIFPVDAEGNIADEPLHEWMTTGESHLIERMPQGNYILREMLAPAGYVVAQDVEFTVSDTGEVQRVAMQDDFTRIELVKVDSETGEPLEGATFQIIDAEGNVIHEWVTTTEPHLIERLPQGEYTLHEVSAPEGYELAEAIVFTVEDTTELQTVVMEDVRTPEPVNPTPPLDQTGRDGSLPFAVIGILAFLTLGGILFAVKHLKKKKGKGDDREKE